MSVIVFVGLLSEASVFGTIDQNQWPT